MAGRLLSAAATCSLLRQTLTQLAKLESIALQVRAAGSHQQRQGLASLSELVRSFHTPPARTDRRLPRQRLLSTEAVYLAQEPQEQLLQERFRLSSEPASVTYRVTVVTGEVRGAGSGTPAKLQLVGTEGQSEEYLLGDDPDDVGFERGRQQIYELEVRRDLGELKRLRVEQVEPSSTEAGSGWFLERVEVEGPGGRKLWTFPCQSWLGKSDAGDFSGCRERHLIPCEAIDLHNRIQEEYLEEPLVVHASAVAIPHPDKVKKDGQRGVNRKTLGYGGEDAYFCTAGRNGSFGLGVADGVYMWKTQGIDSGAFSRRLMEAAKEAVEGGVIDTLLVLRSAARKVAEDGLKGSCTACVVVVDTLQGRLNAANLGDSGIMVLGSTPDRREMHLKFRSPQQEHAFGFPFQLGHQASADHPEDAMLITLPVMPGDVILLGSDGLFDNVEDGILLREVQAQLTARARPSEIARHLAAIAFNTSVDKSAETPYSAAATEAFDMVYKGGKRDDITVVVAYLQ